MSPAQLLCVVVSAGLCHLLVEGRAQLRTRPIRTSFLPLRAEKRTTRVVEPLVDGVHSVERFFGDLFSPIFGAPESSDVLTAGGTLASVSHGGGGYGAPSYDAPSYDPPRRPIVTNIPCGTYGNRRSFGGGKEKGKKEDDCGVFEATEDGFGVEENCEYVHETVFLTKYKTECSKTYSTQCQTSYTTECSTTLSQECRTEYQEECSYAEEQDCYTVDVPDYNNVCETEYTQSCDGGGYKNSYEAPPPCATVPKQVCRQEVSYHKDTECTKVPKRSCVTSPREVCGEVPKQDCKLVPTSTDCKDIPEKLCRQRAYQFPESTTRLVCGLGPDAGNYKKFKEPKFKEPKEPKFKGRK